MSDNELFKFGFGIEEIDDKLIQRKSGETADQATKKIWSAAIVGPDGTGKSILAMHAASEYLGEVANQARVKGAEPEFPVVVYVSTDLSYQLAYNSLRQFGLLWAGTSQESAFPCLS